MLDLNESRQVRRGVSGDLNGRLRYSQGTTLSHDFSARMTGNLARTSLPTSSEVLRTRDYSRGLDGTLSILSAAKLGANLGYRVRHSVVETPLDSGRVQQLVNENNGADLAIRGRLDNDRQLSLTGRFSNTRTAQQGSAIVGRAQSSTLRMTSSLLVPAMSTSRSSSSQW